MFEYIQGLLVDAQPTLLSLKQAAPAWVEHISFTYNKIKPTERTDKTVCQSHIERRYHRTGRILRSCRAAGIYSFKQGTGIGLRPFSIYQCWMSLD